MDKQVEVRYFYNRNIYRPNGNFFSISQLNDYESYLHKKYEDFIDKIITDKGHFEIHLSHSPNDTVSFETYIMVSKDLNDEIAAKIPK